MLLATGFTQASAETTPDGIWFDAEPRALMEATFNYRATQVEMNALENVLARAPMEGSSAMGAELFLPLPRGGHVRVAVYESPVMAPELAARHPQIKTYKVHGMDDPAITGRVDLTPRGFHGLLSTPEGQIYIEPEQSYNKEAYPQAYRSLAKADHPRSGAPFQCHVENHNHEPDPLVYLKDEPAPAARSLGGTYRTFRLALAATVEYVAAVSSGTPSASEASAAMTTAVNRLNEVLEKELSIKLELVANNDDLISMDSSDYSNNSAFALLSEVKTNINAIIGPANYDIGHIFSTGGGGLAQLGVVCGDSKARGVTGRANPVGDPFVIDYVAHEMGHQFDATHTFNASQSSCSGNRTSTTAYEPGSGSTIMAYAGICSPQNLQSNSDAYYHGASLNQLRDFIDELDVSSSCGGADSQTSTGNSAPTVDAGSDYTVPANTPFALTGTGGDADAGDESTLTYTWEENNLGTSSSTLEEALTDDGSRPLFRSITGTSSATRYFPLLSRVLSGDISASLGDTLPTTSRTMSYRLTVRSGTSPGAGYNQDTMQLTVSADAGPFTVTAPVASASFSGDSTQAVTWNVANTDASPVSCSHVTLSYSTDSGSNFGTELAASTPNDGCQEVTIPNNATTQARIKVACADNVFFNVSPGDFTVSEDSATTTTTTANAGSDQTVDEQTNVTLSGSGIASDGSIVSYRWTQTGCSHVNLSGADTQNASFTAPDVSSNKTLVFKLTVTDDDGVTATDTVNIDVVHINTSTVTPTSSGGAMSWLTLLVLTLLGVSVRSRTLPPGRKSLLFIAARIVHKRKLPCCDSFIPIAFGLFQLTAAKFSGCQTPQNQRGPKSILGHSRDRVAIKSPANKILHSGL